MLKFVDCAIGGLKDREAALSCDTVNEACNLLSRLLSFCRYPF